MNPMDLSSLRYPEASLPLPSSTLDFLIFLLNFVVVVVVVAPATIPSEVMNPHPPPMVIVDRIVVWFTEIPSFSFPVYRLESNFPYICVFVHW